VGVQRDFAPLVGAWGYSPTNSILKRGGAGQEGALARGNPRPITDEGSSRARPKTHIGSLRPRRRSLVGGVQRGFTSAGGSLGVPAKSLAIGAVWGRERCPVRGYPSPAKDHRNPAARPSWGSPEGIHPSGGGMEVPPDNHSPILGEGRPPPTTSDMFSGQDSEGCHHK
jgi:hypothetical protein